jgi:hypothetical protein
MTVNTTGYIQLANNYPPITNGQLIAELEDMLHMANEPKRAILTDLLWKAVRADYHGVMDCAADLRELHL